MRRLALAVGLLASLVLPAAAAAQRDPMMGRPRWDTRVFALIPRPGFPAMAYAARNGRVYEGTYDNPSGDTMPSRVLEYDGDGTLMRSWTITGQSLTGAHGVQVGTMDGSGRLLLLDKSPPRVLRLNLVTGEQTTWATFPSGAVPNYSAWGPDKALYVTDYEGATIWRLPPGGGEAKPWLQSDALNGGPFGTTGIVLTAARKSFLVAQQSAAGGAAGNPATGRLLEVPINVDGSAGAVKQLWESGNADGPDGFALARSGNVYIALLVSNQIAVIGPDGTEKERFPTSPLSGANGSPVAFDSPSSARFLGTDIVVANQSYFQGDPTHQAILAVETGEPGLPEYIPKAAKKPAHKKKKRKQRRRRH